MRRLLRRSGRQATGAFLVEGPQAVREALAGGVVREIFATRAAARRHPELVRADAVAVQLVDDKLLAELADTVHSQGLLAVAECTAVELSGVIRPGASLVAVLAAVRDPGNAGTIIRTADAVGADGVVLTGGSVDVYGGKVVRASAGSLFHLPITVGAHAGDVIDSARRVGLTVVAADASGTATLDDVVDDGTLAGPVAWVFGNETDGLPAGVRDQADLVVRVPLYGRAESLNVASAAAVCLYAAARASRARRAAAEPPREAGGRRRGR